MEVDNDGGNENENENETQNNPSKKQMDIKKKAELREKLKKRVQSNRKIIVSGCGDWRCTNPFCKSNIENKDKIYNDTEASKLAIKMIKLKSKSCESFDRRQIIPLKYENIDQLKDEMDEKHDTFKQVQKQIIDAFTHWDILYESFNTNSKVNEDDVAINFVDLDKTFNCIMDRDDLCKDALDALEKSMKGYLNKLRTSDSIKLELNEIRALIILLECPLILSEDIDCHDYLSLMLSIFEEINNKDFKAIKVVHKWLSKYPDLLRLKRILHSLHQYMTLIIIMKESEIEDDTEKWKTELKYDETDDNDEREEISQEIEKRQQIEREKYIKDDIAKVVKFIDILYIANKIIINERKESEDDDDGNGDSEEKKDDESKMDVDNDGKERKLSMVGIDSLALIVRKPLELNLFHNDGLNEAICSKTETRSHIHRRDFIHYKEHDAFTFLSYPYLLTAASKSRYLEFENLLRQHRARRRRMFDLMLGGGVNILNNINRNQLIEELDLVLNVRRNSIIQDTLGILQLQEPGDLRKRLRIIFDGEQGIDQGGLTKEYFQLIMKELFDPNYGMFNYNKTTENYWFNRDCFELADTKTMLTNYELVGKLVGVAIYNNTILDLRFPRVIFKKLLENEPINFRDFRDYDPEMAKGFEQLLAYKEENDGDIENIYCRNFIVKYKNIFGIEKSYDLLNGKGEETSLTKANRQKYVDLYIKYALIESIEQQFNSFLKGFKTVCDSELFMKYSSEELELLICGSKEFDFEALESSTRYEDGLHKDSKIVREFWTIAHNLSDSDKRRLLTFCTGSDRVPINGLGELTLTISKNGNDNSKLPTSHTCFNHLLLPEYSSSDILKERLLLAIKNSEGFGLL